MLVGDANTGWTTHDAIKVASAVRDLDVYIEQPCRYKGKSVTNYMSKYRVTHQVGKWVELTLFWSVSMPGQKVATIAV